MSLFPDALWEPEEKGISVSHLKDWLSCRELALWRIKGIRPIVVSFALQFGILVHDVLQVAHQKLASRELTKAPSKKDVQGYIKKVEAAWRKRNPRANRETLQHVELSLLFAEAVLPIYFDYWDDLTKIEWLGVEHWFRHPYELWNGRKIPFIGKFDAVISRKGKTWLFETKTKSRWDEGVLVDTLPMDLQTNSYLATLQHVRVGGSKDPIGSIHNVIRRPQLRQGKKESLGAFAKRCVQDVEDRPEHYFARFELRSTKSDLKEAEETLVNVMGEFWRWWHLNTPHYRNAQSCDNRYGPCPYLAACLGDTSRYSRREEAKR